MKYLLLFFFFTFPFVGNSQTAGIVLARTYADAALVKAHGREYIKEINVEIIEWSYNSSTDRLNVYFKATFKSWDVVAWFGNNVKAQLKCNLDGTATQLKYDGFFESWADLGSLK